MTAVLLAAALAFGCGLLVGFVVGRLRRRQRSYDAGVRAGQVLAANAYGQVVAEQHRQVRHWLLLNRQRAAVMPFVTRPDPAPVEHIL